MYKVININDAIRLRGEDAVQSIVSTFSCSNKEVETFMQQKAIEFARRKLSVTYFVFTESGLLAGAFTLAIKSAIIPAEGLSNNQKNKIRPFAFYDEGERSYVASAYLLAQFGKNRDYSPDCPLKGSELMSIVRKTVVDVQNRIGGKLLWLECEEDNYKALKFYERSDSGFHRFSIRDSAEGPVYVQMLRLL